MQQTAFDVWKNVFRIQTEDQHEQVDEVRRSLRLTRDQAKQVREEMIRKNHPPASI